MAFCPFSVVLYFWMLIPLALKIRDPIMLPAVFAFATGLPVLILSILLVYSISTMGKAMHKIKVIENIVRKIVALVFIFVEEYYSLRLIL